MMQELRNESKLLKSTLERYLDTCLAVSSQHEHDDVSDIILDELQVIAYYGACIDRSKKAIGKIRNRCNKVVPVNKLPSELLTQIFCATSQPECAFSTKPPAKQPSELQSWSSIPLVHVCSHWRSVALNSQALWTHIDVAPFCPNEQKLLERARLFASSSGDLPVVFHVEMGYQEDSHCMHDTLELCAAVAPRAGSIDLRLVCGPSRYNTHASFIGNLFSHSVPGILRQLLVCESSSVSPEFITPHDMPEYASTPDRGAAVEVPYRHFEEVLRCVTDLRLRRTFFHWTSQAYTGLAKLHIEDAYGSEVTLSQLARVLRDNPRLTSFRFGSQLKTDRARVEPAPVRLNHLESLYLDFQHWEYESSVLRLIIPGSLPLRMTTRTGMGATSTLAKGEHKRFLERSNIVQLHAGVPSKQEIAPKIMIPELLDLMPNLETLSLDTFHITDQHDSPPLVDGAHSGARFATLHLRRSAIDLDGLKFLINRYPITRLTIEPNICTAGRRYNGGNVRGYIKELRELYPNCEFIDYGDPNQVDWD